MDNFKPIYDHDRTYTIKYSTFHFIACLFAQAVASYLYLYFYLYKFVYIGYFICLVLTLILLLYNKLLIIDFTNRAIPLTIFFIYILLSALWSKAALNTITWFFIDLLFPVVFFISYIWAQNINLWRLSFYFEFLILLNLSIIVFSLIAVGTIINPAFGAVRSAYALIFSISLPFLIWRNTINRNILTSILLIISIVIIVILESRIAIIISPIAVIATLVVLKNNWNARLKTLSYSCVIIILLIAPIFIFPEMETLKNKLFYRFSEENFSLNVSSDVEDEFNLPNEQRIDFDRRLAMFVALDNFKENPLLGSGYMTTQVITRDKYDRETSSHGLVSTLLGELGIIGTLLYILIIYKFIESIIKNIKNINKQNERNFYKICAVTMGCLLIFGLFHQLQQTHLFYTVLAWGYATPPKY